MTEEKKQNEIYFLTQYPIDFVEAFISILIIRAIMDKPINYFYVFKTSLVLGLLLYLLSIMSNEYKTNVREGLRNSIGYFIFSQFTIQQ
jgi:hypothetical protein